jgi:hypothetical protein
MKRFLKIAAIILGIVVVVGLGLFVVWGLDLLGPDEPRSARLDSTVTVAYGE